MVCSPGKNEPMKKPTTTTTHLPPDPTRNPNPNRRRVRSPALSKVRLRRPVSGSGGRRTCGPATPLLKWNLSDPDTGAGLAPGSDKDPPPAAKASARKLAAGIWMGLESNVYDPRSSALHTNLKNYSHTPILLNDPNNETLHKIQASAALSNPSMERATKWDPGFYSHSKLLEDQQVPTISSVSFLQSELEQARNRIVELEKELKSAKKKIDHFLRNLAEEKESWRRREHEKMRAVIESIKDDLHREKKNRQRMEIVNSKIVNELAEVKMSAKRFLQEYEKERKARELMEEVCDELAKEIGEDKAEVEAVKVESMRIREEVEEEKKMLQMAEVWREERVQMKLVDAKLTLEDRYSQLRKLQLEIEAFLRSQSNSNTDREEKSHAEFLKEAANMAMLQEVKEFSYQPPPASEDIFSVFEELQPREEPNEREIEPCYGYTKGETNGCLDRQINGFANRLIDSNGCLDKQKNGFDNGLVDSHGNSDEDSGWETVSHAEEQGSSNSIDGSDPSVNNWACEGSNASISGTDRDENGDNSKLHSEISEVLSSTTRQSRKKGSSITRLWRPSYPNNGEIYKHLFEATNGRLSNATMSPDMKSGEVEFSSPSVEQWSSPDSVNIHISRGMKGCIEWPRGTQKHSLKAKLLEARMESQKIQLRQALKQKI